MNTSLPQEQRRASRLLDPTACASYERTQLVLHDTLLDHLLQQHQIQQKLYDKSQPLSTNGQDFLTDHYFGGKFHGYWHNYGLKGVEIICITHACLRPWNIHRAEWC